MKLKNPKLPSPQAALARLAGLFAPRHRFAFLCTVGLGLAVHLYLFVNFLLNQDGILYLYYSNDVLELGRWFLVFPSALSSDLNLPWLLGLLCLLFLGLAMAALTELLGLKNRLAILLASTIIVAWPALTNTLVHLYTADAYMLAVFLCVSALLLTRRWKWGFVPGAVLFMFSLGIYQAYVTFAVLLVLLCLVLDALSQSTTLKQLLASAARFAAMGALGLAGNMVALNIVLRLRGLTLGGAKGADVLTQSPLLTLQRLLSRLPLAYSDFFAFLGRIPGFSTPARRLFIWLFLGFQLVVLVYALVRGGLFRQPWRPAVLVAALALAPIAANLTGLLAIEPMHQLMLFGYCVLFLPMAIILDRLPPAPTFSGAVRWAALGLGFVLCFNNALTANIAYTSHHLMDQRSYSITERLAIRIEATEGYTPGMPALILSGFGGSAYPNESNLDGLIDGFYYVSGGAGHILYDPNRVHYFLEYYHDIYLQTNIPDRFWEDERVMAMESFPAQSSVQVIDGVLVARLE